VVDTVGAGDALLAAATLVLTRTGDLVQSAILGSMAAAVSCEKEGNVSVTMADVQRKLARVEESVPGSAGPRTDGTGAR
jgi:sugar/nucleoside kinase (ribokinase family)